MPVLRTGDAYYIDRPAETFEYVLNYLRDGDSAWLPSDADTREKLRREADFYLLPGLNSNINLNCLPKSPKTLTKSGSLTRSQ